VLINKVSLQINTLLQLVIYLNVQKSIWVSRDCVQKSRLNTGSWMQTRMREVNISNIMHRITYVYVLILQQRRGYLNRHIGIECISLANFIKLIRNSCYARPCVITVAETLRGIRGSWKSCVFCGLDAPLSGLWYALVKKRIFASASIFL